MKLVTGTKDTELVSGIILGGAHAIYPILEKGMGKSPADSFIEGWNITAQSLNDFQPRDAIEARLVSKATALQQHGMNQLAIAGRSEFLHQAESHRNMATKFFRLENETIDALCRYRRGGEQKVTVTQSVIAIYRRRISKQNSTFRYRDR